MYSHPLGQALRNPDPSITPMMFYGGIYNDLMRGNAFIKVNRIAGTITFQQMDCNSVTLTVEEGRKRFSYGGTTYTEKDVLHIPYPFYTRRISSSYDIKQGVGPGDEFADLIALDNAMNAYIKMYFGNSTGKRQQLEIDKDSKLGGKNLDEVYATVLPLLQKYVKGAANSGQVLIPPPGTKLTSLDATQNLYADIKSLKELIERQISQGFGVPYSLISETNKNNSIEQNQIQLLADTIEPLGTHIEQAFNRVLDPAETALYCKYDYKAMLRSDVKNTVDYLAKEVASGLLTVNEARDALDMDAVEAGDQIFVPANLYPLTSENVKAFFAQSKMASHNSAGDDKQ